MPSESTNDTRHRFTGAGYHTSSFLRLDCLDLPRHVSRLLALAQAHKTRVPKVTVRRPLDELELTHQRRFQPPALLHLLGSQPSPQRPPLASGRLANGHSSANRALKRLNSWSREDGVKPL